MTKFQSANPIRIGVSYLASFLTVLLFVLAFGNGVSPGLSSARAQAGDPLLAATPDANAEDPQIIAKAAELGNDPAQIFAFVRDEIRFESYRGSLRGARGTLWSGAGNALDQSNLLIALLRASGVPARYARGVLDDVLAADLIESMFPLVCRVVGELEEDRTPADPASDPQLLAEARDHVWVEFQEAGGFNAADPSFGMAEIGELFTVADERFSEVPAGLRHSVTVRLNVEQIGSFALAARLDPTLTTALEAEFVAAELVGVPLSLSHQVNSIQSGGLFFSNLTHTYTPLLVVGERDDTPLDDETIRGRDYQELVTNFPLGSQFVTGVFLDVELRDAEGRVTPLRHTVLDRIGFAARRGFGGSSSAIGADTTAFLTQLDVYTLSVLPGMFPASELPRQEALYSEISPRAELLAEEMAAVDIGSLDAAGTATLQRGIRLAAEVNIGATRLMNAFFFSSNDLGDVFLRERFGVAAFHDTPRVLVSGVVARGDPEAPELKLSMNVLHDKVRVTPMSGQAQDVGNIYRYFRGILLDQHEGLATTIFSGDNADPITGLTIASAAVDQGIGLRLVAADNLHVLDALAITQDARARITDAIGSGQIVVLPEEPATIGDTVAFGWLEIDEASGAIVSRLEDGSGGAYINFATLISFAGFSGPAQRRIAPIAGFAGPILVTIASGTTAFFSSIVVALKLKQEISPAALKEAFVLGAAVGNELLARRTIFSFTDVRARTIYLRTFKATVTAIRTIAIVQFTMGDPPLPGILLNVTGCEPDADPGPNPAVALTVVPDGVITVPVNEAQFPSSFLANVRNLGPDTDSFALTFPDAPPGFEVTSSLGTVTIPAGAAGDFGLYLKPTGPLPAAGTTISFTAVATSTSDPDVTASAVVDFIVPGVRGVLISFLPEFTGAEPGMPVPATLTLTSVGNVDEVDVTLDLSTIGDVVVAGLISPVLMLQGETATQDLIFTPAVTAPVNSTISATVTATFGTDLAGDPATAEGAITIEVLPDAAGAAVEAADIARGLGRDGLAGALDALGASMATLLGDPGSEAERSRLLALLDSLIVQLDGSGLLVLAQQFTEIRDALATAQPNQVTLEVERLGDPLRDLDTYLSGPARTEFVLALRPDSAVAQPASPIRFDLSIVNNGVTTATYQPSVEGLPAGFSSQFNRTSITLAPGESNGGAADELFLTLTPPADELLPFEFTVRAAVAGVAGAERSVRGSVTLRDATVEVVGVTATPSFVDPGQTAAISARLLNAVNRPDQVELSYRVIDEDGIPVFDSAPVFADLSVLASLNTVDLGDFDTTALPLGPYAIEVTVIGSDGLVIPGAAGEGSLFIGAPLTAALAAQPDTLLPGDSTVVTSLDVQSLVDFPDPSIDLLAQVDTLATANSLALDGNIAYVCGTQNITVIDVADPAAPQVLGAFGAGLINGSGFSACRVVDGHLIVMWQVPLNAQALTILVFTLDNPVAPTLRTQASANVRFLSSLFFTDRSGFISTTTIFFSRFSGRLLNQRGDFWSFDFTDLDNPLLLDALDNFPAQPDGGASNVSQAIGFGDDFALVATTTSVGSASQTGIGRIRVVDISDPTNLTEVVELQIPGTVHATGVDSFGELLLVAGNTEGRNTTGSFGFTGELTLSTVDASDPTDPVILSTLVTNVSAAGRTTVNALGNGFFSVSGANLNGQPVLVLVDGNDPLNIAFNTINTPAILQESQVVGNSLFTPSSAGLGIYDIGDVVGTRFTARVDVPTGTGVAIDLDSFSIPPTEIVSGPASDTIVWERTLNGIRTGEVLSWDAAVTGMQPGETRDVALGATVDFMIASGDSGRITLPAVTVVSDQILALTPASRSVAPLQDAAYTLTVKNPTALATTYDLVLGGVPAAWTAPLANVAVPAGGAVDVALNLQPDLSEGVGANEFFVTASANNGVRGAVFAEVVVDADAPGPVSQDIESPACGVVLAVSPSPLTAGQGGEARYTVQVTNTGSIATSFALQATVPAGFNAGFDAAFLAVPAGLGNARQTALRIAVPTGVPAGPVTVPVTVQGLGDCTVSAVASATLDVAGAGVATLLTPASGLPETIYQLTVTNLGDAADSFDIALAGPLGPFYQLSTELVTLAAGASATVEVSLDVAPAALPGTLQIAATATSQAVPAAQDFAVADVVFPATRGVAAAFQPTLIELDDPGPGVFSFNIENTGNLEDELVATLTEVTGTTTAIVSLRDLDGEAVAQTQSFLVPGLGSASIIMDAELLGFGDVDSVVTVDSQIDPQLTDNASARLRTLNTPPIADAGPDGDVVFDDTVFLDGGGSLDPDNRPLPLSFQWSFLERPDNSQLLDSDILDGTSAMASFTPDVSGFYRMQLTVFDGQLSDQDAVAIDVTNELPVATAGRDRFVELDDDDIFELDDDNVVVLDGSASFDPEGFLITYEWTLLSKPAGSLLDSTLIRGADSPIPFFGLDVPGTYVFQLVVRDNEFESLADVVQVIAVDEDDAPPNAIAKVPNNGAVGVAVPLDGTASFDADEDDFDDLRFEWFFASKPADSLLTDADILGRQSAMASFVPDVPGAFELLFEVSDEQLMSSDQGSVVVAEGNAPPNADAGMDQIASLGNVVALDGSAGSDPDTPVESLAYAWRLVSRPAGSTLTSADILNSVTAQAQVIPDTVGAFVFAVEVSDGLAKDLDNVLVCARVGNGDDDDDLTCPGDHYLSRSW